MCKGDSPVLGKQVQSNYSVVRAFREEKERFNSKKMFK